MTSFLTIKQVNGESQRIDIDISTATVFDLKCQVQQKLGFAPEAQRLIFQGRVLDDKATLISYSLTSGLTVHLALNAKFQTTQGTSNNSNPSTTSPTATISASTASSALANLARELPLLRQQPLGPTAIATLAKMVENIVNHPSEEKYRKIRLTNEALKRKVLDIPHGLACVHAIGFVPGIEDVSSIITWLEENRSYHAYHGMMI
jgi:hypothetical protein